MKYHAPLLRLLISSSGLLLGHAHARAQAYIPDQRMRDWLNQELPGSVDLAGIFDTGHPGIPSLTNASININDGSSAFNADGIQYLTALDELVFQGVAGFIALELPPSLTWLEVEIESGDIEFGMVPSNVEYLWAFSQDAQSSLSLAGSAGIIGDLSIANLGSLQLGAVVEVSSLSISLYSLPSGQFVAPTIQAQTIFLDGVPNGLVDLSAATSMYLFINGLWDGLLKYPSGCSSINCMATSAPTTLLAWPSTLNWMQIELADGLCLPPLPNSLSSLSFEQPPACLPNWPTALASYSWGNQGQFDVLPEEAVICSLLGSDCPTYYPLSGRAYIDYNSNGMPEITEPGVPLSSVRADPGGYLAGCSSTGYWQLPVPEGEYTVVLSTGYAYALGVSPALYDISVLNAGETNSGYDFGVLMQANVQDLAAWLTAAPARPGFQNQLHLYCRNYGGMPSDAVFSLTWDADQSWQSSSVPPSSNIGNTATWNFNVLPAGATEQIVVTLNTAPTVPLGTGIQHLLSASPIANDYAPEDNTAHFDDAVVGSYDPNDKLLLPAAITPDQAATGQTRLNYTIRFQNTGTFPAERVVILDTLSSDLQWNSFQFIASSHDHHWYITDGVLHVIHDGIMLPDSNSNEPGSHGFFAFSMLPATDLQDGATVTNVAHIVFDFNEPIITPPAVLHVDIDAGVGPVADSQLLSFRPNPASDRIQLIGAQSTAGYRIIDQLGQAAQTGRLSADGWLEVQALSPGLYVLEVEGRGFRFVKE